MEIKSEKKEQWQFDSQEPVSSQSSSSWLILSHSFHLLFFVILLSLTRKPGNPFYYIFISLKHYTVTGTLSGQYIYHAICITMFPSLLFFFLHFAVSTLQLNCLFCSIVFSYFASVVFPQQKQCKSIRNAHWEKHTYTQTFKQVFPNNCLLNIGHWTPKRQVKRSPSEATKCLQSTWTLIWDFLSLNLN